MKADLVLDDTEVEQKLGAQKPVENVWEGNLPLGNFLEGELGRASKPGVPNIITR